MSTASRSTRGSLCTGHLHIVVLAVVVACVLSSGCWSNVAPEVHTHRPLTLDDISALRKSTTVRIEGAEPRFYDAMLTMLSHKNVTIVDKKTEADIVVKFKMREQVNTDKFYSLGVMPGPRGPTIPAAVAEMMEKNGSAVHPVCIGAKITVKHRKLGKLSYDLIYAFSPDKVDVGASQGTVFRLATEAFNEELARTNAWKVLMKL